MILNKTVGAIIFLSLIVFVVNFYIYYFPVLNYGYAIGWFDADDHSYSIKLLTSDPSLFFKSIFSPAKICNKYPTDSCRLIAASTNPPLFYLIGGALSFLPIKDVNVGYFTGTVLISFASIAVFILLYCATKNLILSFISQIFLGISIILLWTLQQGLYTAIIGTLFFPPTIYFFYRSLKDFKHKYFIISLTLLNLSASYYLIPFAISALILLFFIALRDRRYVFKYFLDLVNFFKNKKIYLLLIILNTYFIFRIFFIFKTEFAKSLAGTPMGTLEAAAMVTYGGPLHALFYHLPNSFFPFLIFGIFLSCSMVVRFWYRLNLPSLKRIRETKFEKVDQLNLDEFTILFLYLVGISLTVFLPVLMAKYLPSFNFVNVFVADHVLKSINLLPQLFVISFAFTFYYFIKKFNLSVGKQAIVYVIAIIILYLNYAWIVNPVDVVSNSSIKIKDYNYQLSVFMQRNPAMDDNKYAAMQFIRTQSAPSAKILIIHEQYGFESFFFRDYKIVSDVNITTGILDAEKYFANYNYVVMLQETAIEGGLKKYFYDHGFQIVYHNPEILVMQKT